LLLLSLFIGIGGGVVVAVVVGSQLFSCRFFIGIACRLFDVGRLYCLLSVVGVGCWLWYGCCGMVVVVRSQESVVGCCRLLSVVHLYWYIVACPLLVDCCWLPICVSVVVVSCC
jgi:hypothetical protein